MAPTVLALVVVLLTACSSSGTTATTPTSAASTIAAPSTTAGTNAPTTIAPTSSPTSAATTVVTCTNMTGSVTYDPPVRTNGTSPETQLFRLRSTHCTTSGSSVHVTGVTATATIHRPTNSCASLLVSTPVTLVATWMPSSIPPSVASFSGYSIGASGGHALYVLPNSGGSVTVTGSFAGTDGGAHSSGTAVSTMTGAQIIAACTSPAGMSGDTIVDGTATLS